MDQSRFDNRHEEFLDAPSAAEFLGVKAATLYTYVSRGLIRRIPGPSGEGSRYRRDDLERLRARKHARSGHGPVAAAALHWGEPVIDSAITDIRPDGPYYRGRSAVDLAKSGTPFEVVADWLWSGDDATHEPWAVDEFEPSPNVRPLIPPGAPPITPLALAIPLLQVRDPARFNSTPEAERARARRLIPMLIATLGLYHGREVHGSVAESLLWALGAKPDAVSIDAVNQGLVLSADHELNASTFAARVAASTGADLYACLSAGMAALSGPRHGGMFTRIEVMLQTFRPPELAGNVVFERMRLGEMVPGFGHPLYPERDPRAEPLLKLASQLHSESRPLAKLLAIRHAMAEAGHEPPTLDFGMVALAKALLLPPGSAHIMFAVGRMAGWIAHILEQRTEPDVLRPRARYTGE